MSAKIAIENYKHFIYFIPQSFQFSRDHQLKKSRPTI